MNVHKSSCKEPVVVLRFWWNLNFLESLEKYSSIKFNENPSSATRVVRYERIDGQTDMTKLIVAFRGFPKALNKNIHNVQLPRACLLHSPCEKQARGDGSAFPNSTPVHHQPKLPSRSFIASPSGPPLPTLTTPPPEHVVVLPVYQALPQDAWASTFLCARGRWGTKACNYVV